MFVLSVALLSYIVGLGTARFELPPYGLLAQVWGGAKDWKEHWRSNLGLEPSRHLNRLDDPGHRVERHVKSEAYPGLTLLEGLFNDHVGLRLVDMEGKIVHIWPALFSEIIPDPEEISEDWLPHTDWEVYIHGSHLYPDGDVLFNFGGLTLVRMDACGSPEWKLPVGTHHAVFIAEDANIWTLGLRFYEERTDQFPGMHPRFRDDLILEVSPDGEILREISILEVLYRNDMVGMLFPTGRRLEEGRMVDVLHANDVEVLSSERAPAFPLFEAGDVMVSLRNVNLVMILDPDSLKVKWFQTGPWLLQHDPDFHPDGHIVVFDNRDDGVGGRLLGGSRLLAIDPVDRTVTTIYQSSEAEPFFTNARGAVDVLDNGNFLLTETTHGRIFEITPRGEIVWQYINRYDEDEVAAVQAAERYPLSHGNFGTSHCSSDQEASLASDPRAGGRRTATAGDVLLAAVPAAPVRSRYRRR